MKDRLLALGPVLILFLSTAHAKGEEAWSFLAHPPLADSELSLGFDDAAQIAKHTDATSCTIYEEGALADYLVRYPEFAKFAKSPEMLMSWRVAASRDRTTRCLLDNIAQDTNIPLEEADPSNPLFFCGNLSREPKTAREQRAVQGYMFLLSLARPYDTDAIDSLIDLATENYFARFDRRFMHYLLSVKQQAGDQHSYDFTWAESRQMLRPEERRLVENAAIRGDITAVLKILPPCVGEPLIRENSTSTP